MSSNSIGAMVYRKAYEKSSRYTFAEQQLNIYNLTKMFYIEMKILENLIYIYL